MDLDAPAMVDDPAGDEIVVVGVEGADEAKEGVFVFKIGDEGWGLEDAGTVGGGAAGEGEDAAVDGVGGCGFEGVS